MSSLRPHGFGLASGNYPWPGFLWGTPLICDQKTRLVFISVLASESCVGRTNGAGSLTAGDFPLVTATDDCPVPLMPSPCTDRQKKRRLARTGQASTIKACETQPHGSDTLHVGPRTLGQVTVASYITDDHHIPIYSNSPLLPSSSPSSVCFTPVLL